MTTYGKVEEYDESEEWPQYCERLENFFDANEVTDGGKKRAILLTVCGAKIYKLIKDLVSPQKPKDKSFEELTNLVKKHLNPAPSTIVARFKLNSCTRQLDESVSDYVAEIRHLAAMAQMYCPKCCVIDLCVVSTMRSFKEDC